MLIQNIFFCNKMQGVNLFFKNNKILIICFITFFLDLIKWLI